jgi:hypothetical protein
MNEKIECTVCKKIFECPSLENEDIKNEEELPIHCQECPPPI